MSHTKLVSANCYLATHPRKCLGLPLQHGMIRRRLLTTSVTRHQGSRSAVLDMRLEQRQQRSSLPPDEPLNDPFLAMLASPLRRCLVTQRVLPKDLLIKLKVARLPGSETLQPVIVPDGVLHPRFVQTKHGKGAYIACRKSIVERMVQKGRDTQCKFGVHPAHRSAPSGSYKRFASTARMPPSMVLMIEHQLVQRTVQESTMLLDRCTSRPAKLASGNLRPTPMLPCALPGTQTAELGTLHSMGSQILAIIDLAKQSKDAKFSDILLAQTARPIPVFRPQVLFEAISHTSAAPGSEGKILAERFETNLQRIVRVFDERRLQRNLPTVASPPSSTLAVVADSSTESVADLLPFLVSLLRCRLWLEESTHS
ncbi:hypothetical protein OIV83_005152 [Microbotryomycetes sp. JL201]|nr:hypothetical protein OIV83_005152 [Microbotryomycetes sp. JL201]